MRNSQSACLLVQIAILAVSCMTIPCGAIGAEDDLVPQAARWQFDQEVFSLSDPQLIAAAQERFDRLLNQRMGMIDRACALSDAQKKKLELVGRIGIKQLMQDIDDQRNAFLLMKSEEQRQSFLKQSPDCTKLRTGVRCGPFGGDSLFTKTLRNVLTREQTAKFEARAHIAAKSNKAITANNALELVRVFKVKKKAYQLVWNRAGTQVAMLEFNGQADIYAPLTETPLRSFGKGKRLVGFDFSPDETLIAMGENSNLAKIMNLSENREIELQTQQGQPSVKFSPDGKTLATGGYGTKAKLWSTKNGELLRSFDVGPDAGGLTPVFNPDGTVLAVGHRNAMTRLFDVESGRLLHTLNMTMTQGLKFDSTGKTLAVVYVNGQFGLWDVATGKLKSIARTPNELYSVDWTPDDGLLVTAGNHSTVTIWNPADMSIINELEAPDWVISAQFSKDGSKLFFSGGEPLRKDHFVETWAVP